MVFDDVADVVGGDHVFVVVGVFGFVVQDAARGALGDGCEVACEVFGDHEHVFLFVGEHLPAFGVDGEDTADGHVDEGIADFFGCGFVAFCVEEDVFEDDFEKLSLVVDAEIDAGVDFCVGFSCEGFWMYIELIGFDADECKVEPVLVLFFCHCCLFV